MTALNSSGESSFENDTDDNDLRVGLTPDLIPHVQVALRLIGVYFFVIGISDMAVDLSGMVARWLNDVVVFDDAMFLDYIVFHGRFCGSLCYFLAGLYLLVGGHWLIRNVFMPSSQVGESAVERDV